MNSLEIQKLKSVLLCLQAHPDNEPDSEFADRISDLEEIIESKQMHPMDRLAQYAHMYDFNVQIMNKEYNIYVDRDLIDLHSVGGYETLDEAVDEVIKWILRLNRIEP
ncbi:hypothetical protein [Sphingobacterium suaedae]|uniref:Uncharacterized protein n=1 Tax=Sphingobacterium suaedae TaxID=1686402 RepID=A0ABW5KIR0_9SPHI